MRKLVYIGKDNNDTIVKTSSFEEMKKWKEKGFRFKDTMEEIEEEIDIDKEKIAKRQEALRAKKRV